MCAATNDAARFPFDCIVVTSPDEASAKSAEGPLKRGLESRLISRFPNQNIRIISTFDPYGARCGSGGGTLAALEYTSLDETVLILHAGGDSSRCPTQMILGKAWTSLPSNQFENPTMWLIDQLDKLFRRANFPAGSVVVAATDCLVSLSEGDGSLTAQCVECYDENAVLGLAVPAVVNTAKNHGVYVLPEGIVESKIAGIESPLAVWQKPSTDKLISTKAPAPACFGLGADKQVAWIDTGTIIFMPGATKLLRELSNGELRMCTRKGLQDAFNESAEGKDSMEEFAKKRAQNLDLYTDILHNLSWPNEETKEDTTLRQAFKKLTLQILFDSTGNFFHLGTTQELVHFVTSGAFPHLNRQLSTPLQTIARISSFFSLKPRFHCWRGPRANEQNVALWSQFPDEAEIGNLSYVEYSDFSENASLRIGDGTMISGWKSELHGKASLEIPSNLSVQVLQLKQAINGARYALMVLGANDGIKTPRQEGTIFGLTCDNFLAKTGLKPSNLGWSESFCEKDSLWTAKLHPLLPKGTPFDSVYGWIENLAQVTPDELKTNSSFGVWVSSPRVSLKELHQVADATSEWLSRQDLEFQICQNSSDNLSATIKNVLFRKDEHLPFEINWVLQRLGSENLNKKLQESLATIQAVILASFTKRSFDICGRGCMIASALLAPYCTGPEQGDLPSEIRDFFGTRLESIGCTSLNNSHDKAAMEEIFNRMQSVEWHFASSELQKLFVEVLERLSFLMHKMSIASGYSVKAKQLLTIDRGPVDFEHWVLSRAPARVDLGGAWSDTPPVCFEFGGSVTGAAVLVDDLVPLSCRCRVLSGMSGILLRSESRDRQSGSVSSAVEVEVGRMADISSYSNPTSDCALLQCALICAGIVKEEEVRSGQTLQPLINRFFSSDKNIRIEVITTSILPKGSGLGTSSILGACAVQALLKCAGFGILHEDFLLHSILMLEQLLTSGGGWQDQAHGITPGFKVAKSEAKVPLVLTLNKIRQDHNAVGRLEERMLLVYTGKTRLAKDVLQNVLRRWAARTNEVVSALSRNIQLSHEAKAAISEGSADALGKILDEYSDIKLVMTGEESGAMPPVCKQFIGEMKQRRLIKGACLCGAGGGGFMIVITEDGVDLVQVRKTLEEDLFPLNALFSDFVVHSCKVSDKGIETSLCRNSVEFAAFDIDWLRTSRDFADDSSPV